MLMRGLLLHFSGLFGEHPLLLEGAGKAAPHQVVLQYSALQNACESRVFRSLPPGQEKFNRSYSKNQKLS
jgi:hypothetical protein